MKTTDVYKQRRGPNTDSCKSTDSSHCIPELLQKLFSVKEKKEKATIGYIS